MKPGKFIFLLPIIGICLSAACQRDSHSAPFMATSSAQWSKWLDGETEQGIFTRFSVGDILGFLSGPADIKVLAGQEKLDRKVEFFDVRGLTRRQAFLKLSKEHGLSLQWATAHEPRAFLGVPETESTNYPVGVPRMSHVCRGDPSGYQQFKKEGRINAEEVQGGDLYYAVATELCFTQSNGARGMGFFTERFRIAGFGDALRARGALLELMRAAPKLFEGADPGRFEKVELQAAGDGRFKWGAFIIDAANRTYSAVIESPAFMWAYNGRFVVETSDKWKAENLGKLHADRL